MFWCIFVEHVKFCVIGLGILGVYVNSSIAKGEMAMDYTRTYRLLFFDELTPAVESKTRNYCSFVVSNWSESALNLLGVIYLLFIICSF